MNETPREDFGSVVDDVLHDFQETFHDVTFAGASSEQSSQNSKDVDIEVSSSNSSDTLEYTTTPKTPQTLNVRDVSDRNDPQSRLARIEQKITALNEESPEYMEERVALEDKKNMIQSELGVRVDITKNLKEEMDTETKKDQQRVVEELLKKKFSYIAPIMSPDEEERRRLEKASEAEKVDRVRPPTNVSSLSEHDRLSEAAHMRKEFLRGLTNTPKAIWYESPSQNRDAVTRYVYKTAEYLSGKKAQELDMHDIQTARLFLFNNAPQEVLEHPAYAYVESFYNYQNERGFSGKDIDSVPTA